MRNALAAGAILLSTSAILATPVHAQGGAFMWCQASAVKDGQTSHFYSAFFAAEAWQASRKALAFANELKKGDAAGAEVTAKCKDPADYKTVVDTRNAAMKAAPGKVTSWEG